MSYLISVINIILKFNEVMSLMIGPRVWIVKIADVEEEEQTNVAETGNDLTQ